MFIPVKEVGGCLFQHSSFYFFDIFSSISSRSKLKNQDDTYPERWIDCSLLHESQLNFFLLGKMHSG